MITFRRGTANYPHLGGLEPTLNYRCLLSLWTNMHITGSCKKLTAPPTILRFKKNMWWNCVSKFMGKLNSNWAFNTLERYEAEFWRFFFKILQNCQLSMICFNSFFKILVVLREEHTTNLISIEFGNIWEVKLAKIFFYSFLNTSQSCER